MSLRYRRGDAISTGVASRTCQKEAVLTIYDNIDWKLDCCFGKRGISLCRSRWSDLEEWEPTWREGSLGETTNAWSLIVRLGPCKTSLGMVPWDRPISKISCKSWQARVQSG